MRNVAANADAVIGTAEAFHPEVVSRNTQCAFPRSFPRVMVGQTHRAWAAMAGFNRRSAHASMYIALKAYPESLGATTLTVEILNA